MEKYLALILLIILHLDVGNGNLLRQRRQDYYEDDYYPEEEEDYPTEGGEEGPVTVYKNGKIYTVAGSDWWLNPKTAVVVADGKIKYVGDDASAENFAVAGSKIVDLGGKTVLPGIHDVHQHPLEAGDDIVSCQLDTDTSPDILKDYVFDCAQKASPTEWVLGNGHSIRALLDYLKTGGPSPRALLDSVVPDRPVVMLEETSHSVWVNSKALEKAGFLKGVADPAGGVIMKDSTGEPNGILLENAGNIVMGIALDPTTYPQLLQKQYDGLVYTLGVLAENGITSVVDARCYWKRSSHETYEKVKKDGLLTSRAVLALWAYPQLPDSQIDDLKALFSNTDPMLRRNQIKVYSDGLLDSTTAAMFSPYKIELGLGLGTGNTGMNYFTEARLEKFISELQGAQGEGFDFVVHTIGERGVAETVTAIENAKVSNLSRHRLTHLEIVNDADMTRMANSNILGDLQVAGTWTLPEEAVAHIGGLIDLKQAEKFIPVNSLRTAGVKLTLSSDYDVSPVNPFQGLKHAMNRGAESVELHQAIEMYTINAAYTMRQENTVGSLEPGKDADMIVISQDIFANKNTVEKTQVLQTLLAGNEVYRRSTYKPTIQNV